MATITKTPSRTRTNVVESRAFTERLEDAIARYHANAITTAEVLQELIQLAKDLRAARERGEANGMTNEEIAFYDALAEKDRKSTRLNSSHVAISYAVFCL